MDLLNRIAEPALPWALFWCLALLSLRTLVIFRRGYRVELGVAKGSPGRGILYSLTFAMLPWKKDSTRRHPWTYAAGMGLHLGVFASFLFALGRRFWSWPEAFIPVFGLITGIGLVSGLGLLLKRVSKPYMMAISSPDDLLANVLVELWLLGATLTAWRPDAVGLWRLAAILLLLYLPLGKIYHMFLFFVSRSLFGLQFGRRGVLRHDLPVSY